LSHGLRQLLADDPCSFLLYAIEQVQEQAHHRRLGRVLRRLQRRKYELGWVHVSDLEEPCERVIAARLLGYTLPQAKPTPQLQRILENGTYMHLRYYNYFLSLPPPFEVQVARIFRHWPIIGEADVVVFHPEFNWQIIELKSMNERQFKSLRTPQSSHVNQLNGYLGLFDKAAPLPQKVVGQVWYECKNTQNVKTYPLPYNPTSYLQARQRLCSVSEGVLAGRLPPACGGCELDEYVGSLEGVEEKIEQLSIVKEQQWLPR